MNRSRLPDRRLCETFNFECNAVRYTASISRFSDGTLSELFISSAKVGSDADLAAKDAAVVCSIALQYGVPVHIIRHGLLRDGQGRASSPLGAALDLLAGVRP